MLAKEKRSVTDQNTLTVSASAGRDWLSRQELDSLTPAALAARMSALQPLLAEHAEEAESLRRPVDAVFSALRKSGVFYHFVPRRFGGLEFGVQDFIDVVLPLGEACASTAWVTAFCMEHNLIFSLFPEAAQEEIFGQQPYVIAPATAFPPGRAEPESGGYRVSGRWTYASGVMHADWAMVQALADPADRTSLVFLILPIDQVTIHDTWRVDGLAGTGSHDMSIDGVFVPAHRAMRIVGMNNGTTDRARIHKNPLYAMPMATFLALTSAIPSVGAARGALRLFQKRLRSGSGGVTDRAALHALLGEADVDVYVSESMLRDCGRSIYELAERGDADNIAVRSQLRARIAHCTSMARDAIRKMIDASSSGVHALSHPLQRALRDATMTCSHVLHDRIAANELNGRVKLGLAPLNPLI